MFKTDCQDIHPFQIIRGGAGLAPSLPPGSGPARAAAPASEVSPEASALAVDMAALYALALLRETGFDALDGPGEAIRVPGAAPFGHPALCADIARMCGAAGRSVADLLGRITGGPGHRLSTLWAAAEPVREVANGGRPCPPELDAPVSAWVRWCAQRHGAALAIPGRARTPAPASVADLSRRIARRGTLQPVLVAALLRLAQGAAPRIGTPQLMIRLLSELSERLAARSARLSSPSGPRPGVLAGQLALLASGEPASTMPDGAVASAVLAELDAHVPRLLVQLAAVNAALPFGATVVQRDGTFSPGWCPVALEVNLCLPPLATDTGPMHPATLRAAPFEAACLAAALRIWLPHDGEAGEDLDRLVRDVALAAAAPGGLWPHEIARQVTDGADYGRRVALESLIGLEAQAGNDAPPRFTAHSMS